MAFKPNDGNAPYSMELHKMLFNPFSLWDFGMIDNIIRGAANQNPRPIHSSFTPEVRRSATSTKQKAVYKVELIHLAGDEPSVRTRRYERRLGIRFVRLQHSERS